MNQGSSNFSKVVQEDTSKRTPNTTAISNASIDGTKRDVVVNSTAPISMGLLPTQLITVQLNNV